MRRCLIIANLTLGSEELSRALRTRMNEGPCEFHVLVPAAPAPLSGVHTDSEDHARAAERLEEVLESLRRIGATATGEVGDVRPFDAALDVLERDNDFDEVIVSTLPAAASRWLRLDLVSKLHRNISIPVTHIEGEPAPTRT